MKRSIYLLGFRGAGKSTLLASLSHAYKSFDLDAMLEERFGKSILEYVEEFGLAAFRQEEYKILEEMEQKEPALIATGGGFVDWPESRKILARSPHARVFLRTPEEILWSRLSAAPDRRKIHNLDSFERMQALLKKRSPYYEELATHILDNHEIEATKLELQRLCHEIWLD